MNFHIFKNLKIWHKLLIIFQFMMLPALIIFFVLMISTNKMNNYQNSILLENVTSITAASNLENSLLRMRGLKAYYLLDGNSEWLSEFNKNVDSFNMWYDECFRTAYSDEEHDILSTMSVDFARYMEIHKTIISISMKGDRKRAEAMLLDNSNNSFDDIFNGCEKLIKKNKLIISETERKLQSYTRLSRILAYVTLFCFFIFGIMLIILVTKSIVVPIKEIEQASRDYNPDNSNRNEIEMIKERFRVMTETIADNQQKLILSERRAAIGEIAAGISHELNNPIGIIYGFSEVLAGRSEITEGDREFIEDIFRESQRCKKLLKDLLDFAKSPDPCYIETDIKNLIYETVSLIKNQSRYSKIVIDVIDEGTTRYALLDHFQIKQVILNLLLNACDAIGNEGEISIFVNNNNESLMLSIRDSGPGIEPALAEKIFNPFFSTKPDGVGLGLAVCRDIISRHNGTIAVAESIIGGAEFVITIPAGEDLK